MTLNPRIREARLYQAVNKLAPYYGLKTNREDVAGIVNIIRDISLGPNGIIRNPSLSTNDRQENTIADLLNELLHSPIGALNSENIAARLNRDFQDPLTADLQLLDSNPTELEANSIQIGSIVQIIGDDPAVVQQRSFFPNILRKLKYVGIVSSENQSVPILDIPESERPNTKMSIFVLNSPQLNISNRYAKMVSLFLNGVPKLDFAKAVPYLEVNFELPIPPVDEQNRLLLPSIYKFILGGVVAGTETPLYSLQTGLSSSSGGAAATNTNPSRYQNYSIMGMEAFVSPQIIYNRKNNMLENSDVRVNDVIDPTRPILSLKSFTTTEVPSYATNSYRTAQLQFTLHDRSRMPDIAPFIRADLRGNTRVDIEFGWHHPDGEDLINTRRNRNNVSPYADLINGMRKREKYQIRNSSFSFRENGSVDISLELVTLGQSQLASELIVGSEGLFTRQVEILREIQERLARLLERTRLGEDTSGGNGEDRPIREIRGIQALEPASDAFSSGLRLNSEQITQLNNLRDYLMANPTAQTHRAPILREVGRTLDEIWGANGTSGVAAEVRTSLQTEVTNVINSIRNYINGRPSGDSTTGWAAALPENLRGPGDPLIIYPREGVSTRIPGLSGIAEIPPRGRGRAGAPRQNTPPSPPTPPPEGTPTPPPEAPAPATETVGLGVGDAAALAARLGALSAIDDPGLRAAAIGLALPGARPEAPAAEAAAEAPATGEAATPTPATAAATGRRGGVSRNQFSGDDVPSYLRGAGGLQNFTASLATIMANFIGKPLMETNLFEEIQFIYYPFNENAGYANRINIANFEVNLGMLTELLIQYRMNNISRSGTMTLQEFWTFIVTNIIDNPAASSYGLWDSSGPFYRRPTAREETESGTARRWTARPVDDETTLNSRISNLLRTITPTGDFHPPQLRMFTECVPLKEEGEGEGEVEPPPDNRRNILKIHIYDQQATSVSGIGEILEASRNLALSLDGRPDVNSGNSTPLSQQWTSYRERLINQAATGDNPIIRLEDPDDANGRYVVIGGSRAIKNFVMNNHPYLLPGTQLSLINNVNLSSMQDEAASTLNLVNAPRPAEIIAPNGEEPGGLPLQVIPVEMTMNTYGCPLLGFATHFFVDLKTGTTADDLYSINQITSEMQPGKYSSQIKLRPISGYTRYRNFLNELREIPARITELQREEEETAEAERIAAENRRRRARTRRRPVRETGSEGEAAEPEGGAGSGAV